MYVDLEDKYIHVKITVLGTPTYFDAIIATIPKPIKLCYCYLKIELISYAKIYFFILIIPFNFDFPFSINHPSLPLPILPISNFPSFYPPPLSSPHFFVTCFEHFYLHCWHLTPLGEINIP